VEGTPGALVRIRARHHRKYSDADRRGVDPMIIVSRQGAQATEMPPSLGGYSPRSDRGLKFSLSRLMRPLGGIAPLSSGPQLILCLSLT
jgi:hypothetical protein